MPTTGCWHIPIRHSVLLRNYLSKESPAPASLIAGGVGAGLFFLVLLSIMDCTDGLIGLSVR